MSIPPSTPPPNAEWLAKWLRALAARLSSAREHLRERIVSAVGDTFAEAAETAVRVLVRTAPSPHSPYGLPQPQRYGSYDDEDDWDREPMLSAYRPSPPPEPPPEPPRSRWRPYAFAGLHAAAWWLRLRAAGPFLTALAAAVTAALMLLD